MGKSYIDVYAYFDTIGNITPVCFWWGGKQYEIDKVIDVRRAPALIGGGIGIRYTCRAVGKERRLWFDDHVQKWFVEIEDKIKK